MSNIEVIKSKILAKLKDLEKENSMLQKVVETQKDIDKTDEVACLISATSISALVQGVYTKVEEIFYLIAKDIDKSPIDKNQDWHSELLFQMTIDLPNRNKIIQENTNKILNELRGFRHAVRNNYGSNLRLEEVLKNANLTFKMLPLVSQEISEAFNLEINKITKTIDLGGKLQKSSDRAHINIKPS